MSSESNADGAELERCMDGLASLLRTWGRFAIDTREVRATDVNNAFEAWARHLLLSTPPPGKDAGANGPQDRDWLGLQRFVADTRRDEHDFVVESLRDLRDVIWVFVEAFSRSMHADQKSDDRVIGQLDRLRESAKADDVSVLKTEALRSASIIEGAITVREARYQTHIERLSGRLEAMAAELVDSREKGAVDALTGVYNRAALDEQLQTLVNFGRFVGDSAVLFMIDIDHFKWVNDSHGHSTGDELLRRVGRGLKRALRRDVDFVARFGGDEFVAVVHGVTDRQIAETADRIAFAVREVEVQADGEVIRVSASIGAARLSRSEDPKAWLKRADDAMYSAKQAGRDRIVIGPDENASSRKHDESTGDNSA